MSAQAESYENELDLTEFPVVDQVTRKIHEPLTHDDYQQRSHELGALERRINSEELGLKAYSKMKRGEIETLEEERGELIRLLDRGIGRDVECDVRLDESRKLRLIVRRDNGELLDEEPFKTSDYPPPLFAAVAGEKPIPHSRTIREAFVSTLEGQGGADVQKLHGDGLLDPTAAELEAAHDGFDVVFPASLRETIAENESDLDRIERELAGLLTDDPTPDEEMLAVAINSREVDAVNDSGDFLWTSIVTVRECRAEIDAAHELLMVATAEATEPSDRTEQIATAPDPEPDDVELEMTDAEPHSRTLRTLSLEERVGRLGVPEYWTAHDTGMLDPSEDDLSRARTEAGGLRMSAGDEASLLAELDAVEQDLAADISTSAKARMAITRGTFPTKAKKVDDAITLVRELRARLDVDVETEVAAYRLSVKGLRQKIRAADPSNDGTTKATRSLQIVASAPPAPSGRCTNCQDNRAQLVAAMAALVRAEQVIRTNLAPAYVPARPSILSEVRHVG